MMNTSPSASPRRQILWLLLGRAVDPSGQNTKLSSSQRHPEEPKSLVKKNPNLIPLKEGDVGQSVCHLWSSGWLNLFTLVIFSCSGWRIPFFYFSKVNSLLLLQWQACGLCLSLCASPVTKLISLISCFIFVSCREMMWRHSSARWTWAGSPQERLLSPHPALFTHHPSCHSQPNNPAMSSPLQASSSRPGGSQALDLPFPNKFSSPHPHPRDSCNSLHLHR